ncbi:hypothetical protein HNY73_020168 [Argiope bruennichi]|uniref:Uncharacterized protein n=1 Tax=Argiope bruennichi TaxID=94029 RepID=A0A8T0E739_ARGBR|nr:hypothetical protein HNY73_020168 [Argiope bruennichi]
MDHSGASSLKFPRPGHGYFLPVDGSRRQRFGTPPAPSPLPYWVSPSSLSTTLMRTFSALCSSGACRSRYGRCCVLLVWGGQLCLNHLSISCPVYLVKFVLQDEDCQSSEMTSFSPERIDADKKTKYPVI